MACGFNNSNAIYDGGNIPEGNYAAMFWVLIASDRNTYTNFLVLGADGASPNASIDIFANGNGTQSAITCRDYNGLEANGHNMVVGEWYNILATGNCSTGQTHTIRTYRLSDGTDQTATANNGTLGTWGTGAGYRVQYGQIDTTDVWLNGSMTAGIIWAGVTLTRAEWLSQLFYRTPVVQTGSVWAVHKMRDNGDNLDASGNGRNLTFTSITTTSDPAGLTDSPSSTRFIVSRRRL